MREIKFRAWDSENKIMLSAVGAWDFGIDNESGDYFGYTTDIFFDRKQAVLMQYTGLKDKNGVEIYEGDVVKSNRIYDDKEVFEEVRFEDSEDVDQCGGYSPFLYSPFAGCDSSNMSTRPNKCEVVGNIYQNSELLDNK